MKRFVITLLCTMCILAVGRIAGLAQTLPATNDLKLWLRADAGVTIVGTNVTQWADQSGNGNDAIQASWWQQPTWVSNAINGQPVLRFFWIPSVRYDHLSLTNQLDLTGGLTVFVVAKRQLSGAYNGFFRVASLSWAGNADLQLDFIAGGTTNNGTIRYVANTSQWPDTSLYSEVYGYNAGPAMGSPLLYDVRAASGGIVNQRVNGVAENDWKQYGTNYLPTVSNYVHIGTGQQGNYWDGDIAEVIVYNAALSPADQSTVYEYLVAKYAIPEPSVVSLLLAGTALMLYRLRPRE